MKKSIFLRIVLCSFVITIVHADEGNPSINYEGFVKLTNELNALRQNRRVSENLFLEMSKQEGVVILDSRSKAKFDKLHVKGALHLNFSDFTEESLRKLIPNKNTKILIYCNNNFSNEPANFPSKKFEVALNIPTFLNLHAYGYRNVYELKPLLDIGKTKIIFEGASIPQPVEGEPTK